MPSPSRPAEIIASIPRTMAYIASAYSTQNGCEQGTRFTEWVVTNLRGCTALLDRPGLRAQMQRRAITRHNRASWRDDWLQQHASWAQEYACSHQQALHTMPLYMNGKEHA